MTDQRIYLSPPDMSAAERAHLLEAFDSNWVAPVGPDLGSFESDLGEWTNRQHVVALSSGTAALHLALLLVGVQPGDEVLVSSLTFVASANAIAHAGAIPVFVDSSHLDWNVDPDLVEETLDRRAVEGRLPRALVAVDLYGQCCDYVRLTNICARYDVALISDAAESLGALRDGRPGGSSGRLAALSFNGNKIATTGGGGALVSDDEALIRRARYLATQARMPTPHYEHTEVGYNYRLSNLLAAVGRGQLSRLEPMMQRRRAINGRYGEAFSALPGVSFMPVPSGSAPNNWLTVITIDPEITGVTSEDVRLELESHNIESRAAWKPMHQQPLFAHAQIIGGAVSDAIFDTGLCLPSGSSLADDQLDSVISIALGRIGQPR